MQHKDAKQLLEKYRSGTCSPEEKALIEYWFHHLRADEDHNLSADELEIAHTDMWHKAKPPIKIITAKRYIRVAAAIFILFGVALSGHFLLKAPDAAPHIVKNISEDIAPGGNKAILTLSNGQQIVLTDARNGNIATEHLTLINKTEDGQVVYEDKGDHQTLAYNTITTPRGGQYSLTLSDGTKVFLNAASSLKYPVAFSGTQREVELTGEGYFEVAHNAAKPFKVSSGNQVVEVLGTHFNINSYSDTPVIKTTLIEGSVKISAGKQTLLLKPGQQSQAIAGMADGFKLILNKNVDVSTEIAWKNGLFQFNDAAITEVMQNAARWYDLDVVYEGDLPVIKITGQISRKVNLSGLLELMKFAGASIKTEGRKVTISK
nr:FecR family protein [Pedobacter panaciterrae]